MLVLGIYIFFFLRVFLNIKKEVEKGKMAIAMATGRLFLIEYFQNKL